MNRNFYDFYNLIKTYYSNANIIIFGIYFNFFFVTINHKYVRGTLYLILKTLCGTQTILSTFKKK